MSKEMWSDVLLARRNSSDLLWLTFHPWNCSRNELSRERNAVEVRNAVFDEPVIKALLRDSPELRKHVTSILEEMAHSWSLKYIRFVGFFLTKVMKSIYRKVLVCNRLSIDQKSYFFPTDGNLELSSVLNNLAKDSPILYMPTHRSYADFLLFSYVCFDMNLPLPSIAAGIDFLSLNQVASLLRACGAFFIRRSFKNSGDFIYWHTFRAYVQAQLRGAERPMEFFIEGTRSRSGKFLYPKIGLLSIALELFLTSQLPELIVVPVSISYDRTLEEELYAKELIPPQFHPSSGTKPKETTTHLLKGARSILSQDFGSVYVRFGEPISIREYVDEHNLRKRHSLEPREFPASLESSEHLQFINSVAVKVISQQKQLLVVSPFTLFCLCVLSKTYISESNEMVDMDISVDEVLADIKSFCAILSNNEISNTLNNRSLDQELIECFKIHKKLVNYSGNRSINIAVGDPLVVCQIRHYSNQAFQLMIDVALCCYAHSVDEYFLFQELLSREFVFSEIGSRETYEKAVTTKQQLTEKTALFLAAQTAYFVDCYSAVMRLMLSSVTTYPSVKELVKAVHSRLDVPLDIVQNAILLLSEKNIVERSSGGCSVFVHHLMDFSDRIEAHRKQSVVSKLNVEAMKAKL